MIPYPYAPTPPPQVRKETSTLSSRVSQWLARTSEKSECLSGLGRSLTTLAAFEEARGYLPPHCINAAAEHIGRVG